MCHNSGMQSAQIERFMANGMPQKIVKTVEYTLRKRAREHSKRQAAKSVDEVSSLINDCDEYSKEETTSSCDCSTIESAVTPAIAAAAAPPPAAIKPQGIHIPTEVPTDPHHVAESNTNKVKIPKLCGRFRQIKDNTEELITSLSGDIDLGSHIFDGNSSNSNNGKSRTHSNSTSTKRVPEVYVDMLAVGTQLTKQFSEQLSCAVVKLQSSKICTLLTKTTQPAHLIAFCVLITVLLIVAPELYENAYEAQMKTESRKHKHLAAFIYLGAFATHFGAQIWMTFISGLSLYFSLPRHTFGQCQQILFPKYFALNSVLSISMLILFVKYFLSRWSLSTCVQLSALALTAFIEVAVRLYLAPPMLRLMHEKYKIEGAIGSGQEVGTLLQGDLVQCPHYQRIHKAFRRIHMTIAMGNMTVLLATCLHLYFLASKIQIT